MWWYVLHWIGVSSADSQFHAKRSIEADVAMLQMLPSLESAAMAAKSH